MLIMETYTATLLNRYNHININNISEKETIIEMYRNEKSFGENENRELKKLIEKNFCTASKQFLELLFLSFF